MAVADLKGVQMRASTRMGGALATLAVAAAMATPAVYATPTDNAAATITCDPSAVPPPPSSIAASAAKEYAILRACAGQSGTAVVSASPAEADQPSAPSGFDWVSGALAAAATAGLALVVLAAAGLRKWQTAP
jgi:hypothetical protein